LENEKCIRCGNKAEINQNVYVDGTIKKISYCKSCLKELLKYEVERYTRAGLQTILSH